MRPLQIASAIVFSVRNLPDAGAAAAGVELGCHNPRLGSASGETSVGVRLRKRPLK